MYKQIIYHKCEPEQQKKVKKDLLEDNIHSTQHNKRQCLLARQKDNSYAIDGKPHIFVPLNALVVNLQTVTFFGFAACKVS